MCPQETLEIVVRSVRLDHTDSGFFANTPEQQIVLMSHGDAQKVSRGLYEPGLPGVHLQLIIPPENLWHQYLKFGHSGFGYDASLLIFV